MPVSVSGIFDLFPAESGFFCVGLLLFVVWFETGLSGFFFTHVRRSTHFDRSWGYGLLDPTRNERIMVAALFTKRRYRVRA